MNIPTQARILQFTKNKTSYTYVRTGNRIDVYTERGFLQTIIHPSVSAAKRVLGQISSSSKMK